MLSIVGEGIKNIPPLPPSSKTYPALCPEPVKSADALLSQTAHASSPTGGRAGKGTTQLWWMEAAVLPSTVTHRSQAQTFSSPQDQIEMTAFIINLNLAVTPQPPASETVARTLFLLMDPTGSGHPPLFPLQGWVLMQDWGFPPWIRLFHWGGREFFNSTSGRHFLLNGWP